MVSWAMHRLNGISSPANAAYSASELAFQLKNSRAKCIFTCLSLLPTSLKAAEIAQIPPQRIYLCPVLESSPQKFQNHPGIKTLENLIVIGKALPEIELQKWTLGQGKRQIAFSCYSSGTSGLSVCINSLREFPCLTMNRKESKFHITISSQTFSKELPTNRHGGRRTPTIQQK
jgi:acyl-CoA synthetase (AMP-forming)/AMP-acid ligase II